MIVSNGESPILITKKCDGECREKIERKLSNIRNVIELDDIDLTFPETEIVNNRSSISEIEELMEMWKYLSKLAIYLYNDYKFFSQLIVKTNFYCLPFENTMKSLGYIKKCRAWFPGDRPELDVIINTIFSYGFYCSIFKSMKTENPEKCKRLCSLCDSDLSLLSNVCSICYTVNEDIKIQFPEQIISNPSSVDNKIQSNVEEINKKITEGYNENPKMTNTSDNEESGICKESTLSDNDEFCFAQKSLLTSNVQVDNKENDDIINEMNDNKSTNDSVSKENVKDQWTCKTCTFINNQDALNCYVCSDNSEDLSFLEKQNFNQKDSSDIISLKSDLLSIDETVKEPVSKEIKEEFKTKAPDISEAPKSMVTMRQCFKCNQVKVENDLMLCKECSKTDSICVNKACTGLIPIKNNWCPSCGVKKDADMRYANCVKVRNHFKIIKEKWQCGFCYTLMNKYKTHCKKCNNTRDSFLE